MHTHSKAALLRLVASRVQSAAYVVKLAAVCKTDKTLLNRNGYFFPVYKTVFLYSVHTVMVTVTETCTVCTVKGEGMKGLASGDGHQWEKVEDRLAFKS